MSETWQMEFAKKEKLNGAVVMASNGGVYHCEWSKVIGFLLLRLK